MPNPRLIQVNAPGTRWSIHWLQLRDNHDMTDKPIDWTPDLTLPTSKSTVQHLTKEPASTEAGRDARLDQAIEDDEVRERLGLTRGLRAHPRDAG